MLAIIGVRAGIAEDEAADLNRDPVDILGAVLGTAMRVVGVVAAVNVLRGLPKNRTPIGAALADTATEVTSGIVLAALFTGDIATSNWSTQQTAQFQEAVTIAGLVLTVVAAALVGRGILRTRSAGVLP
ncbi:hypothetical protein [Streptomyces sp. NPDC057460]|uniref:hypothetical protein n=1 Tax=Streptomyces sp. NPDC057460 TaxID=3346141 RepID=UPI0036C21096